MHLLYLSISWNEFYNIHCIEELHKFKIPFSLSREFYSISLQNLRQNNNHLKFDQMLTNTIYSPSRE